MSDPSGASPSPPPPVPGTRPVDPAGRERPFWGPVDVFLAIPVVFLVSTVGVIIAASVSAGVSDWTSDSGLDLPVYGLFIAVVFQQFAQGWWPWFVARRKGFGWVQDWGLRFELPRDIKLGLGLAVICLICVNIATIFTEWAVSLPDDADPSNTAIISDNEGSPWLLAVIFLVVIGAPLTEEVLFRGLILKALDKALGHYVAIIGSTILFTLPHIQGGATWQETAVLFSGIFMIGLVLAIAVHRQGRLGPAIIAHFLFNLFGTVATLVS